MSVFRFARLIPGTTQLHETGHYSDRVSAELNGHRTMIADRHAGGAIIEYISGPDTKSRVVSAANVLDFSDFVDDYVNALAWWHGLSEETKQQFADGSLELSGSVLSDVGQGAIIYSSIGGGSEVIELSPPFADFVAAIVGEPAPWLENASVDQLRQ